MAEETEVKPGYKTSEFWLSAVATIGGLVLASGAFVEGDTGFKIASLVMSALASMGYSASRGKAKSA